MRTMSLPQGQERWVVVLISQAEACAQATRQLSGRQSRAQWRRPRLPSVKSRSVCETDVQSALAREPKGLPLWLDGQSEFVSSEHHAGKRRPCKEAAPTMQWHSRRRSRSTSHWLSKKLDARRASSSPLMSWTRPSSLQEVVTTYKE